jgi:hypothetical protein
MVRVERNLLHPMNPHAPNEARRRPDAPNEPIGKMGQAPNEPNGKMGQAPNEPIGKMGQAPNEPNPHTRAPNEAIGKIGKAPNEANPDLCAPNEPIGKIGKAPNEANNELISTEGVPWRWSIRNVGRGSGETGMMREGSAVGRTRDQTVRTVEPYAILNRCAQTMRTFL